MGADCDGANKSGIILDKALLFGGPFCSCLQVSFIEQPFNAFRKDDFHSLFIEVLARMDREGLLIPTIVAGSRRDTSPHCFNGRQGGGE